MARTRSPGKTSGTSDTGSTGGTRDSGGRRPGRRAPSPLASGDTPIYWVDINGRNVDTTYRAAIARGWMPPDLTQDRFVYFAGLGEEAFIREQENDILGVGGGGGGAAAATFAPQDERTVREQVKAYVIATTGKANEAIIKAGIDAFMEADRVAFNVRKTERVDPWNAVQEVVRASEAYKAANTLRPDSVDEMDWIVDRQAALRQIGLSGQRAEEVGIELATAGAGNEALVLGGSIAQQVGTGRQTQIMRDKLKRSARAALGVV